MSLSAGTRLAHYEILEPIGKGGMGEVYRAKDTKLRRDVAIKVLPDEFARDQERLARFQREAELLAALNHANIATIHGLEESGGTRFLVMELVEGETLAETIARGPIPLDEAFPVFKQIAEGLEAAHEKAVIHRDLKPANIKIAPDGKPKILDFGLAKGSGEKTPALNFSESPTVTRGTAVGVILGTAPYMSPEQARGQSVDKRTDIWAFGCCLFEALTGRPPFVGKTITDILAGIVERAPDWETLPAATPPPVRRLLRRCLIKTAADRLQHVGDARIEIAEALTEPAEPGPGVGDERRLVKTWRQAALVAIVLALMATGVAVRSLMNPSLDRPVTRTVIPLQPGDELALEEAPLAFSLDGRHVAYIAFRDGTRRLVLRDLDQLEARLIESGPRISTPFFSSDSQWLGFRWGSELMKVPVSGGAPVVITKVTGAIFGTSWGPDGRIVYNVSNTGLLRVSAEGGESEILTVPNRERREIDHRRAEVLPNDKGALFTLWTGDTTSFDEASIAVLSFETGEYRVLIEGGMHARYSATGHIVYARDGSLLAVPFDLDALQVKGTPIPVLHGVTTSHLKGSADFNISRDGSLLYAPGASWGSDRRVIAVDREGRSQPLIETPRGFYGLRLSPDGRSLALAIDDANISLWAYDMSRGTMSRLASGFHNHEPVWSPESDRVIFAANRGGSNNNLFLLATDGSGELERLTTSDYHQYSGSWSPDGKILAYEELHPDTSSDIWLLSMEGDRKSQPFLQTEFRERRPVFSPNGQWLAYESNESGSDEVYIRPFPGPGGRWQVSAGGGTMPRWNANGEELFYRNGDKMMVVHVNAEGELRLGTPRLLFEKKSVYGQYDVMPDGQSFVMIDDSEAAPPPTQLILVQNWTEELKRLVPTDN